MYYLVFFLILAVCLFNTAFGLVLLVLALAYYWLSS